MKKTIAFLCMILMQLTATQLFAQSPSRTAMNKVIGVRVDDVVKHLPQEYPLLTKNFDVIRNQQNLAILFEIKDDEIEEVHNLFFNNYPRTISRTAMELDLTLFAKLKEGGFIFKKSKLTIQTGRINGAPYEQIGIRDTYFEVEAGLIERKVILTDSVNNMKMIFPIGVGGFDEGIIVPNQTSLVTPRFQQGWLDKREAYATRQRPAYFAGQPFLRITTEKELSKGYTAIAFHAQPNLAQFFRGFDSNGCMRMQTEDLIAFHRLLMNGRHLHLSVKVLYRIQDVSDHPLPKIDTPFKLVKNAGTAINPAYELDPENDLVMMTRDYQRSPQVNLLRDQSGDQYHTMFNYDSRDRRLVKDENGQNVTSPVAPVAQPPVTTIVSQPPVSRPTPVPPTIIPEPPRQTYGPRNVHEIRDFCMASHPYHEARLNVTRNRLINAYNRCVNDWVTVFNNNRRW